MTESRRDNAPSGRVSSTTLSPPPKVSVGLAVYNGERYLHDAISSIVAQTFRDFELIICDNDSIDGTREICLSFAAEDERIRYLRNPVNIGGVRNENRTMFLARGEYFKLAAHDDLIAPEFLERCVAVLDSNDNCDVCVTGAVIIGERGEPIETRVSRAGSESRRSQRIRSIADWRYSCEASYGLMRMSALREVRPQMNHVHSDRVVLSELALRRPFVLLEEPLFYKRIYEHNAYADPRGRMVWYQPESRGPAVSAFPTGSRQAITSRCSDGAGWGLPTGPCASWNSSGAIGTCGATGPRCAGRPSDGDPREAGTATSLRQLSRQGTG